MKVLFRKLVSITLNFLMRQKSTIPIANLIHKNGSFKLKDFFILNVKQPKFNFYWEIKLLNQKTVKCLVQNNQHNTWHLAVTYNWHDIGVCILEHYLNNYYKSNYAYFDIGSNIGFRSIYALSQNRHTVLFDPNPEVCELSQQLIRLNDFKHYKIEQIGVSNEVGELNFYITALSYMSSFIKEHAATDKIVAEIKIPVTTINLYLKANPQYQPKIVKIDVEGFEINVLKGATDMLSNYKPALLIEILDTSNNRKAILDYLATYNYEAFYLFNKNVGMLESAQSSNLKQNHNYLFIADEELKAYLKSLNCFAEN